MKRFFLLVLLITSIFVSCKKYYSTVDTQVLQALTDTFSIKNTDWKLDTSGHHYVFTKTDMANLMSNANNTAIIDSGAVLIYLSADTGKTYELLPANYVNNYYFKGQASEGQVSILAYHDTDTTAPGFMVNIKVITFPSAIAYKTIGFDPQNYSEAMKALHLEY